jgi:hypothetical protein
MNARRLVIDQLSTFNSQPISVPAGLTRSSQFQRHSRLVSIVSFWPSSSPPDDPGDLRWAFSRLTLTVSIAQNSSDSCSSHARASGLPSDLASATRSQYFDSWLSFREIAFFAASSLRLYEPFDSARLAPIELPASKS